MDLKLQFDILGSMAGIDGTGIYRSPTHFTAAYNDDSSINLTALPFTVEQANIIGIERRYAFEDGFLSECYTPGLTNFEWDSGNGRIIISGDYNTFQSTDEYVVYIRDEKAGYNVSTGAVAVTETNKDSDKIETQSEEDDDVTDGTYTFDYTMDGHNQLALEYYLYGGDDVAGAGAILTLEGTVEDVVPASANFTDVTLELIGAANITVTATNSERGIRLIDNSLNLKHLRAKLVLDSNGGNTCDYELHSRLIYA